MLKNSLFFDKIFAREGKFVSFLYDLRFIISKGILLKLDELLYNNVELIFVET